MDYRTGCCAQYSCTKVEIVSRSSLQFPYETIKSIVDAHGVAVQFFGLAICSATRRGGLASSAPAAPSWQLELAVLARLWGGLLSPAPIVRVSPTRNSSRYPDCSPRRAEGRKPSDMSRDLARAFFALCRALTWKTQVCSRPRGLRRRQRRPVPSPQERLKRVVEFEVNEQDELSAV